MSIIEWIPQEHVHGWRSWPPRLMRRKIGSGSATRCRIRATPFLLVARRADV